MLRRHPHRETSKPRRARVGGVFLLTILAAFGSEAAASSETNKPPSSPLEFYNDGTQKLQAGKLREAEISLQSVLSSQNEKLQTAALYNLGHVRFKQGAEELKQSPGGNVTGAKSQQAQQSGGSAIHAADEALAGD